ncbi:MAG: hypothetical protein GX911_03295 [Spirochaetales bacterium]|nr:hypothetical protein [Spirochaetales bacterium]
MKTIRWIWIPTLALLLGSCTVSQRLDYSPVPPNAGFTFAVEEFFVDVLEDFSDFSTRKSDRPVIDQAIDDFELLLDRAPSTKAVRLEKTGHNAWNGTFIFTDVENLVRDLGAPEGQQLLKATDDSLTFYLTLETYPQLVPIIPFLADENFEAFGPEYNQGLSEEDYLEMISFMLGEEGPPAIEKSTITLRVTTPKPIRSMVNGRKLDQTTYEFSFPLIDFLLLAEPITFTVRW